MSRLVRVEFIRGKYRCPVRQRGPLRVLIHQNHILILCRHLADPPCIRRSLVHIGCPGRRSAQNGNRALVNDRTQNPAEIILESSFLNAAFGVICTQHEHHDVRAVWLQTAFQIRQSGARGRSGAACVDDDILSAAQIVLQELLEELREAVIAVGPDRTMGNGIAHKEPRQRLIGGPFDQLTDIRRNGILLIFLVRRVHGRLVGEISGNCSILTIRPITVKACTDNGFRQLPGHFQMPPGVNGPIKSSICHPGRIQHRHDVGLLLIGKFIQHTIHRVFIRVSERLDDDHAAAAAERERLFNEGHQIAFKAIISALTAVHQIGHRPGVQPGNTLAEAPNDIRQGLSRVGHVDDMALELFGDGIVGAALAGITDILFKVPGVGAGPADILVLALRDAPAGEDPGVMDVAVISEHLREVGSKLHRELLHRLLRSIDVNRCAYRICRPPEISAISFERIVTLGFR